MTCYAVRTEGQPPEFFTWPQGYVSPIRSKEPLTNAQEVQLDSSSTDPIVQGFLLVYRAEKATYQKIWERYGGLPSKDCLAIKEEFCKWLSQQKIKKLDFTGINLCAIDLTFLSCVKELEELILVNCGLNNEHADQLQQMFANTPLKRVDLSCNSRLERAPRLEHVEAYAAKNCAISKPVEGVEIDLSGNFFHPYGEPKYCYVDSESDSDS